MTHRSRLRLDVSANVAYDDQTPWGTPVGVRPDETVREAFGSVLEALKQNGIGGPPLGIDRLVTSLLNDSRFRRLVKADDGSGPGPSGWSIRDEVLYPEPRGAPPRYLTFCRMDSGDVIRLRLPANHWPIVHGLVAALVWPGFDTALQSELHPDLSQIVEGLRSLGLMTEIDADRDDEGTEIERVRRELARYPYTFVGHNTVVMRSATSRVIIDPLLPARNAAHPPGYAPLQVPELGPVDAIVITHSHPDHFAPATLLRFPVDTTVVVPRVERETILTVAMGRRLRELGFVDVREVDPGDRLRFGDMDVFALPFLGEQPTAGRVLHPEIRNAGCTYVIRTPDTSAAFLADSGRDASGDVRDVAACYRAGEGPVDIVFCGYRGWTTYPLQLLSSSVARYGLFVPPELWAVKQQLMCDVEAAIDVAERFGARVLVPYADGGAPWHWDLGLGPRLDGSGHETPDFDPFPERVVRAAGKRAGGSPPPVLVQLLRPCDSLADPHGYGDPVRVRGHCWPYP
jgi:L-ascorbate metabolism protein UlaG (beta-lactamase superfamily)